MLSFNEALSMIAGRRAGGYGTSAYIDPAEDLVGILMTQRLMDSPASPAHYADFWTATYAAIND